LGRRLLRSAVGAGAKCVLDDDDVEGAGGSEDGGANAASFSSKDCRSITVYRVYFFFINEMLSQPALRKLLFTSLAIK
jgi:hypothetical protein